MGYIDHAKEIAEAKGGRCLGKSCKTTKSMIWFVCSSGHEWSAPFYRVRNGSWCKKCVAISQRKTIEDARCLAEKYNFKCVSEKYDNNYSKLKWKCNNNHIFYASYNKISSGRRCPYCSKRIKYDIGYAKTVAKNKGGECLSNEYERNSAPLKWRCNNGHVWKTCLSNILYNKWCPVCAKDAIRKYTIKDAKVLAERNSGKCISSEYKNFDSALLWECASGHIWKAPFKRIKYGSWCPHCKLVSQTKLSDIMAEIFNTCDIYINYRGFDWLTNKKTKCKQEIDIFIKDRNSDFSLAVEYDGHGHFFPVRFGGCSEEEAKKTYLRTIERDRIKDEKIMANKNDVRYFIRFNYRDKLDINNIKNKLKENNIPVVGEYK